MTTTNRLRQRLDALAGKPMPPALAAKATALQTLHDASVSIAGNDRVQWLARCATGRATSADLDMLALLPADALKAAVADDAIAYAKLMHRVLSDF